MIKIRKAGYFVWDIPTDTVWCDDDLAMLLGLQSGDGRRGFPVAHFMARVHIEDIEFVAATMKKTLASCEPYDMTYRIIRDGTVVNLRGRGRCYRQDDHGPTIASGIIEEIPRSRSANDG